MGRERKTRGENLARNPLECVHTLLLLVVLLSANQLRGFCGETWLYNRGGSFYAHVWNYQAEATTATTPTASQLVSLKIPPFALPVDVVHTYLPPSLLRADIIHSFPLMTLLPIIYTAHWQHCFEALRACQLANSPVATLKPIFSIIAHVNGAQTNKGEKTTRRYIR